MSAKVTIQAIVARELRRLQGLPALTSEDIVDLQQLAKTAAVADGLEAGEAEDPAADSEALTKALRG